MDTWLLRISGLLLVAVGGLKFISVFTGVAYLFQPDPVLTFISNRNVLLIVGNLEIVTAAIILGHPESWLARYGLLALCATFAIYRLGLALLMVHQPCPCLGRASDWLHLSPHQVDLLSLFLLGILSVTGVISIFNLKKFNGGFVKDANEQEL